MFMTLVLVDLFQYKGSTFRSFSDAEWYEKPDFLSTSAAEAINSKIKRALYHMRFICADNMVIYL